MGGDATERSAKGDNSHESSTVSRMLIATRVVLREINVGSLRRTEMQSTGIAA